ncbi:MAG TPA: DNA polymerase III subunit delta', partial [Usitatibacter sp.]|nr:DNA polymerase III subunit delta' [Usitatibacter sp.]
MKAFPWHQATLAKLLADRTRLPHALLVQGPMGIGKTDFARALAAGALCESPKNGLACGACASCHWFSQGNHPDYREVVPEAAASAEDDGEAGEGEAPR